MSAGFSEHSIHTKKYYRVILESIDPELETPDSFAIKLATGTRTPISRAKMIVRHLPCKVKSGLSSSAANRLKSRLEDFGGRVRLETHYVTPGEEPLEADDRAHDSDGREAPLVENLVTCPECGWREPEGVFCCTMCQKRLPERPAVEALEPPSTPPTIDVEPEAAPAVEVGPFWSRFKLLIPLAAALALVLLVLVLKQG